MRAFLCNFFSDSDRPADINRLNEFCTVDTSAEHYIAVNGSPFPGDDKETTARLRPAVHRYLTQRSPNSVFVKTQGDLGGYRDDRRGKGREAAFPGVRRGVGAGLTAEQAGHAVREHWGIENRNHYVRDVSLAEDNSRIRKTPGVMARIKSFALNILRANHTKNVAQATWENALCFENILKLKGI